MSAATRIAASAGPSASVCCEAQRSGRSHSGVSRQTAPSRQRQLRAFRGLSSQLKAQRGFGAAQQGGRSHQLRVQAVAGDKGEELDVAQVLRECSETANEELLLFFFQQDLESRLQRALNMDQYDVAQTIRKKIEGVATAVRTQAASRGKVFPREATADAADKQTALNQARQLKREMQLAVEQERYKEAAALRDKIKQAELSVLAASAALASANSTEYKLHLGQRVQHKVHGYVGIVCGMDRVCYETPEWLAKAYGKGGAEALPSGRGTDQPFYLVLPDVRAIATVAVNYVAEDMLEPAPKGAQDSPLEHPYTYIMFLGPDAQGGYVPTKQLREKYNAARRDVHPLDDEEGEEGGAGGKASGDEGAK